MISQRPVFLDMLKMRFPVMAIVSILHRISGVVIFLFLPFMLYLLQHSLSSQQSFDHQVVWLHKPGIVFLVWLMLSAISYHLLAGLRHLLMDCGFAEHVKSARISAYTMMLLTLVCMILLGVWLW